MSNKIIKHGAPTGEEFNRAAYELDADIQGIGDETIDRAMRWGAWRAKDTDMLTITVSRKILQDLATHLSAAAHDYDEYGSAYDSEICHALIDWIMLGENSGGEDKCMDEQQASKYLGVTEDTLEKWRKHKIGPDYEKDFAGTDTVDGINITYKYRYTYWQSDLDDWKENHNEQH